MQKEREKESETTKITFKLRSHLASFDVRCGVTDTYVFQNNIVLINNFYKVNATLFLLFSPSMATNKGKELSATSAEPSGQPSPVLPSRYESQKRRDWNTFGQYLKNQRPPVALSQCSSDHVLEFLRYLDQFGKTKVHLQGCGFFGQPEPPSPCPCPLKQAWGSLDALIGRLRAAYEENGGSPETNPFASGAIRVYLRQVRDSQAKARGIPYKKKKKKNKNRDGQMKANEYGSGGGDGSKLPMPSTS